MGRPLKNNVQISLYLSSQSQQLLERLKTRKAEQKLVAQGDKKPKVSIHVSMKTHRVLELLQRESTDQGEKKSKGWFIDQALESYVADQDEQFKNKKRTKSECVEQALKIKYRSFYDPAKSSEDFNLKS